MDFHKPSQTVLITSRSDDQDNVASCDFHMPVSYDPGMYAVALEKGSFSEELITKSNIFVVNFMPFRYCDEVKQAGLVSGRHKDKFQDINLRKDDCKRIDCFYLKESSAFIECEVSKVVDSGDHTIFIGSIINHEKLNDEKRILKKEDNSFTTTIH